MRVLMFCGLLGLAGCQTAMPNAGHFRANAISPAAAVIAAAEAAPRGVPGRFGFVVAATAMVGPRLFLNSHRDYRDQRNLSVAIEPLALRTLRQKLGADPVEALRNRAIEVDGVARRTRIDFTSEGRPTGKYYYQTHVAVTDSDQITILD